MSGYLAVKSCILVTALLLAFYYDLRENKIKNFITMPLMAAGLVINGLENGISGLGGAMEGMAVTVLVLLVFYIINVMGAGDIKLFSGIGALMGVEFTARAFACTVFIAAPYALLWLLKNRLFKDRMGHMFRYFKFLLIYRHLYPYSNPGDHHGKMPFAAAIVPGTLLCLALVWGGEGIGMTPRISLAGLLSLARLR